MQKKKIIYFDMDNVLVDFPSAFPKLSEAQKQEYEGRLDEVPHIFSWMLPLAGSLEAVQELSQHFEVYILSTAPWDNPTAWTDKLLWIKKHLPKLAYKRLILSHNKQLNLGDYLIDDRTKNGAGEFTGEHIHFGQTPFETWEKVLHYIKTKEGLI